MTEPPFRALAEIRATLTDRTHLVEFHADGWTVLHPMSERLDGSLLDCTVSFHHLDGPPRNLGLYFVTDEGEIGDPCTRHDFRTSLNLVEILDDYERAVDRAERAEAGWAELERLLHANEVAFDEDTSAAVDELDSWVALARRALNMIADFDLNDHDADVAASWIDAYGSLTGERP